MTKSYKATLAFCGAVLLGLALPALAQPGPHGHGGPGGPPGPRMIERMTQELNLTDDQATQLRAIVSKYHDGAAGDAMKAFHDARASLETLIADPASTDQQVMTAAKAVSAQGEQAAVQRHRMAVEINAILTPEQRQKAKDLKAQGWSRHGQFPPPAPDDAPEGE